MNLTIKQQLEIKIRDAVKQAMVEGIFPEDLLIPEVQVESPKNPEFGDFATNISFPLTKILKKSPHDIAAILIKYLEGDKIIRKTEVAGAGFINFWIAPSRLHEILAEIEVKGERYGSSNIGQGKKTIVEFLSANPTGPLHVGHGRGAAIGDIIGNILDFCGYDVTKEYYINDVGNQMVKLGASLQVRYLELLGENLPLPDEGYQGEYMIDIAKKLYELEGNSCRYKDVLYFKNFAMSQILEDIKQSLLSFGVHFNSWFAESTLYQEDMIKKVLDKLKEMGYTYDANGALWLKTTAFGDDKDRVLIRENQIPTYFTGDIAYHCSKYVRGYELLIDLWGADHHGYINRLKAACLALNYPKESLVILLYQLVSLSRGNQPVSMSTRQGEFVTLTEVIQEVGKDAARFFFCMRKSDAHLDFDLELAKSQSQENPVYYVQYAHARICSILRKARESGLEIKSYEKINMSVLNLSEELMLLSKMSTLQDEVSGCARSFEPHRLTIYLMEIVAIFHNYYNHHRIISSESDITDARLFLVNGLRIVLKNTLSLLGISAPEVM
ncbi:MAG: arginine--tRNA ligase [Candidatus Desantisbacteria bacterium]